MANIQVPENPGFPGVYQWELDDDVIGGPDGTATRPIRQLTERTEYLKLSVSRGAGSLLADMVDGSGRNLLDVLGVATIAEAMAEIRRRCNNNGEIDASKIPDFSGIMIGDYIDGIDLSDVPAENGGSAGQAWNDTYCSRSATSPC